MLNSQKYFDYLIVREIVSMISRKSVVLALLTAFFVSTSFVDGYAGKWAKRFEKKAKRLAKKVEAGTKAAVEGDSVKRAVKAATKKLHDAEEQSLASGGASAAASATNEEDSTSHGGAAAPRELFPNLEDLVDALMSASAARDLDAQVEALLEGGYKKRRQEDKPPFDRKYERQQDGRMKLFSCVPGFCACLSFHPGQPAMKVKVLHFLRKVHGVAEVVEAKRTILQGLMETPDALKLFIGETLGEKLGVTFSEEGIKPESLFHLSVQQQAGGLYILRLIFGRSDDEEWPSLVQMIHLNS